jgi:chemotaxis signal transduction protein
LGINILFLREINRHIDLTPVDLAPSYVCGLMNLRGQIVTVIDLGVRLGLPPRKITAETGCIVLKSFKELPHDTQQLYNAEMKLKNKDVSGYEGHRNSWAY